MEGEVRAEHMGKYRDVTASAEVRESSVDVHPEYAKALRTGLVGQVLFGIVAALTLDGGAVFQGFLGALLVQCIALLLMLSRRPLKPTSFDLAYVRYGIILNFAGIMFIYAFCRTILDVS
ncbi:hypothetical protein [Botrimarina sp.]|uniref:hypothetical protein n=1 Tax=Botrimarina sp. TaxID=2795802 RepID=UPI0032ECA80E